MNNEWISEPSKMKNQVDQELLKDKIKNWTDRIDSTIEDAVDSKDNKKIENLKEKLKEYRNSGLEKDGELSYENLVFKFLRRSGHIQKLFDTLNKTLDKELSVETQIQETLK